ncbi:hypothetical protein DAI22_10g152100 [Oryza sativa Japonica Group]|nr:hypothetical protein DAI22_10g152100 [Oryza sativa Japonica Group]
MCILSLHHHIDNIRSHSASNQAVLTLELARAMVKWAAVMEMLLLTAAATAVAVVAAQCDPEQLSACVSPIFYGTAPSESCCSNLRAQQKEGCLCQYAKDPTYASYVNNTNARKTIAACGIPIPSC